MNWEKYGRVRTLLANGASDEEVLADVGELGAEEVGALLHADTAMKEEYYGGGPSSYSTTDWQLANRTEEFATRLAKEMSATRYACTEDGDSYHITVLDADGDRIGEMGVCRRDHTGGECKCEGSWVYWGLGLSTYDLETLPREGPNPLTGA